MIVFSFLGAAVELIIGCYLMTDKVPMGIYDLLWYRTTGYFSRSVPDPNKRLLRWAGGLMMVDAGLFTIQAILPFDTPLGWLLFPMDYLILACLGLAFFLPWFQPFQKSKRDQQWKEMVLDEKDCNKQS